jgi:hypothetical protein
MGGGADSSGNLGTPWNMVSSAYGISSMDIISLDMYSQFGDMSMTNAQEGMYVLNTIDDVPALFLTKSSTTQMGTLEIDDNQDPLMLTSEQASWMASANPTGTGMTVIDPNSSDDAGGVSDDAGGVLPEMESIIQLVSI